ncbi:hypothetical protein BV911_14520 [Pseudoruegeria sp. SK021]|nr:hypothetical protein BV911_14520 [Pseudoruegeria sp. SK021]
MVKILWHDGVGMSLYLKRLEAGKFIWPASRSGDAVQISAAQLGYLLEGIGFCRKFMDFAEPPLSTDTVMLRVPRIAEIRFSQPSRTGPCATCGRPRYLPALQTPTGMI